jgi:hypothetical protein
MAQSRTLKSRAFDVVKPGSFQFPAGDSAKVEYYDDGDKGAHFGYLKVTLDATKRSVTIDFMGVQNGKVVSLNTKAISFWLGGQRLPSPRRRRSPTFFPK